MVTVSGVSPVSAWLSSPLSACPLEAAVVSSSGEAAVVSVLLLPQAAMPMEMCIRDRPYLFPSW